jgi:hypothetical protein
MALPRRLAPSGTFFQPDALLGAAAEVHESAVATRNLEDSVPAGLTIVYRRVRGWPSGTASTRGDGSHPASLRQPAASPCPKDPTR